MDFGKLRDYKVDGQKIILNFESKEATIEVITPQIINVFCGLESNSHNSKAIEGDKSVPVSITVEKKQDGLCPSESVMAFMWTFLMPKEMKCAWTIEVRESH